VDELDLWADEKRPASCDFRHFLHLSRALGLDRLGRAEAQFMSYGAYRMDGTALLKRGVFSGGATAFLDARGIAEDLSHAWYATSDAPQPPYEGETRPDAMREAAYSWCKAPRLSGQVVEVGALARQLVDGHPLIRDLVARGGANAHSRVVARLLEIALVVNAMGEWIEAIQPGERFILHGTLPEEARGAGLTEAARGSLGHWLKIEKGRIANYQIIAPTTWNFSPRDAGGVPGALEQALVGTPVRPGETEPVAVQHVVRSFDPCLVCTVH
jgi:hydrogenase large subunit